VFAHGWWTKDGEKISKSLGNVIDPFDLVAKFGVDATRFFLMAEVPFGNDGDYSENTMIYKCNANLSNGLGSLAHRVCTLVYKNCDQAIPRPSQSLMAEDEELLAKARGARDVAAGHIANQQIHLYASTMSGLVKDASKYIDTMAPWGLKKTDPERMNTVLYVLMEVIRHALILYQPLIPESANKILDQLTVPETERTFAHLDTCPLKPGEPMELEPTIVLPRFEVPEELGDAAKKQQSQQKSKQKKGNAKKQKKQPPPPAEIDVGRLDIRVGVITKAWEHEDADKLFLRGNRYRGRQRTAANSVGPSGSLQC